jgi:hypothetical protein
VSVDPRAVFPDSKKLLEGHDGQARFSVVPGTDPPVCVLYCVNDETKTIKLVCIRTWRGAQMS